MMSKLLNKPLRLLFSAALLVVLSSFLLLNFISKQQVTEVRIGESERFRGSDNSKTVVCYFVEPDFQLRWIHSVEKQWWEEQYSRQDNELLLTNTYFQAFGAGTPSTETFATIQKPGYVGYQINEQLPSLSWVVSRLTQGELDYADHRLLIHNWMPDYSEVIIMPKTYHLMDRLKKDLCHDIPSNGQ